MREREEKAKEKSKGEAGQEADHKWPALAAATQPLAKEACSSRRASSP